MSSIERIETATAQFLHIAEQAGISSQDMAATFGELDSLVAAMNDLAADHPADVERLLAKSEMWG